MKVRVVVAVLLALVVGAGAGYAVSAAEDDGTGAAGPVRMTIGPVPASSPSLPVPEVNPDPDDPTLETGIALDTARLTIPGDDGTPKYVLSLPVPVGWDESFNGVSTWKFTVPGNSDNSFGMRVEIVADEGDSIAAAVRGRTAELDSAEAQGNFSDLDIELFATDDGFDANFIDDGGYRRISIERYFDGPDGRAFAAVAVFGRVEDRLGLEDLIARVTSGVSTTQP